MQESTGEEGFVYVQERHTECDELRPTAVLAPPNPILTIAAPILQSSGCGSNSTSRFLQQVASAAEYCHCGSKLQ